MGTVIWMPTRSSGCQISEIWHRSAKRQNEIGHDLQISVDRMEKSPQGSKSVVVRLLPQLSYFTLIFLLCYGLRHTISTRSTKNPQPANEAMAFYSTEGNQSPMPF